MIELDFSALDAALVKGDFANVSAQLGVDVDAEVFARITAWCEALERTRRSRALAMLRTVLVAPDGILWDVESENAYPVNLETHVLAVKWSDGAATRVTLGMGRIGGGPQLLWPELDGWAEALPENRERAEAWARGTSDDRVTVTMRGDFRAGSRAGEELLANAIAENPDNDELRLAYADWLEERGDVRAELIRSQLGISDTPWERMRSILEASWRNFAGELAPWMDVFGFVGGMPECVDMTAEEFLKDGERLFNRYPIRDLTLQEVTRDETTLERVANSPVLRKVVALTVYSQQNRPLAVLGKSPHFERLKKLVLGVESHSTKDWAQLFSELRAPALQKVFFLTRRSHPSTWRALAENASLTAITDVGEDLVTGYLPDESFAGMRRLIRGDDLIEAMKRFAARPGFDTLKLRQAEKISDATLVPLFASSSRASMRTLDAVASTLTDATLQLLSESSRVGELRYVTFVHASFSAKAVCAFLKSDKVKSLIDFVIDGPTWAPTEFDEVYETLRAMPASRPLRKVQLPKNPRRDEAKWLTLQQRFSMSEA